MKKHVVFVMAIMLSILPAIAQAEAVTLIHDDGTYEGSMRLGLPATPGVPIGLPSPAVQFNAPGDGAYALDTVSFHLVQMPNALPPIGAPGGATPLAFAEPVPQTYPMTVQIWSQGPGSGADWVAGAPIPVDLVVSNPGLYVISLASRELTFTGPIRIGILLRKDEVIPVPGIPVHLGVDKDGKDGTAEMPFGHSYRYNSTVLPPSDPWIPDGTSNFSISASVHLIPEFKCQGFLPPFNRAVPMRDGGRILPLMGLLRDQTGNPGVNLLLTAPPLVRLLYAPDEGAAGPIDVTASVVPAGNSNTGLAFRHTWGGLWIYNLKTNDDLQPGIYTVLMESGDGTKYMINPVCSETFAIEDPKPKRPHPPKPPCPLEAPRYSKSPPGRGYR